MSGRTIDRRRPVCPATVEKIVLRRRRPRDLKDLENQFRTAWADWSVLVVLRGMARRGELPERGLTTSSLAARAGVTGAHLPAMLKRGRIVKVNPERRPNEEFRWTLAERFTPKRWEQ